MTDHPHDDPQPQPSAPDGASPPQPCDQPARPAHPLRGLVGLLTGAAAVAVAGSLIVSHQTMALPGSTQSSRLLLQERQAQIGAVIAQEAQAAQPSERADQTDPPDRVPGQDGQP